MADQPTTTPTPDPMPRPSDPEPPVSSNPAEWLAWRHREMMRTPPEDLV